MATKRALQQASRQANQALLTLTSTQPSRNQLIPMTCSYQIAGQPHLKEQAEQLAQRYRDEGKLYIAHLPNPPDPNGVLIAYLYEGHILVQTMEDYYPEYFPKEQAEEHAGLIISLNRSRGSISRTTRYTWGRVIRGIFFPQSCCKPSKNAPPSRHMAMW